MALPEVPAEDHQPEGAAEDDDERGERERDADRVVRSDRYCADGNPQEGLRRISDEEGFPMHQAIIAPGAACAAAGAPGSTTAPARQDTGPRRSGMMDE